MNLTTLNYESASVRHNFRMSSFYFYLPFLQDQILYIYNCQDELVIHGEVSFQEMNVHVQIPKNNKSLVESVSKKNILASFNRPTHRRSVSRIFLASKQFLCTQAAKSEKMPQPIGYRKTSHRTAFSIVQFSKKIMFFFDTNTNLKVLEK